LDLHYASKHLRDQSEESKWFSRARTNIFQEIIDTQAKKCRVLLFPKLSYLNHSCSPNATLLELDGHRILVAGKDIKEGEEVCICYHPSLFFLPEFNRKEILKGSWDFDCTCDRCLQPLETDKYLTEIIGTDFSENEKKMNLLYSDLIGDFPPDHFDMEYIENAKAFMKLPLHFAHWRMMKVRQSVLEFCSGEDRHLFENREDIWRDQISAQKLHCPFHDASKMRLFRGYLKFYDKDSLRIQDSSFTFLEKYI